MKLLLTAAAITAAASLLPVSSAAAPRSTGVGQPPQAASCVGIERATRNSRDGNREHGQFGIDQREFVALFDDPDGFTPNWPIIGKTYYSYGEWLKDARAFGC